MHRVNVVCVCMFVDAENAAALCDRHAVGLFLGRQQATGTRPTLDTTNIVSTRIRPEYLLHRAIRVLMYFI